MIVATFILLLMGVKSINQSTVRTRSLPVKNRGKKGSEKRAKKRAKKGSDNRAKKEAKNGAKKGVKNGAKSRDKKN